MPKSGAYIVSDLQKDRPFRLICEPCDKVWRFNYAAILERFGPDQNIPELIGKLANCPKRGNYHNGCRAGLAEPIYPNRG